MSSNQGSSNCPVLTTANGAPIGVQQALTAGPRGPLLMQDVALLEQMQHFNRERIPERVVHAKGSGAYGTFTVTHDITKYTKAAIFAKVGKKTETFLRFSTVAGERGAADAERDVRGFAVKFYTDEGNWDLVGNNTPVFFVRDPYKFQMFIHTQKRHPQTNLRNNDMQWDFWSPVPRIAPPGHDPLLRPRHPRVLSPPPRLRQPHLLAHQRQGRARLVQVPLQEQARHQELMDDEAAKLIGATARRTSATSSTAIERGEFPKWRVCIQVMTEQQAKTFRWNPFDLTKVWPHKEFPLIEVGELELNRNPENYFAEVEQAAFKPSALVPGIGASPDKMLQARLMSYADTHLHRLGVNHHQIPVNKPRCPVMNYIRDGQATLGEYGSAPNYWPNTIPARQSPTPPTPIPHGNSARQSSIASTAPSITTTSPSPATSTASSTMASATASPAASPARSRRGKEVQIRQLCHFFRADEDYGQRIANHLGINVKEAMAALQHA
jgi:catalase